ncbi:MAG: bifunctional oligoribonuclease/PAP phosphatase NrnA [Clostridiales bacterium]|nr:bifunctional oligoribonuclease/PAP phosphatase NrnA [Clostridiales bacterium]
MSESAVNLTISDVCDRLETPSSVLILTHTRPDADTLGSAFALRELLRGLGKRCEVINDDDIPKRLGFIFNVPTLRPEALPDDFEPDMYVSVDVSASKLLGKLEEEYAPKVALAIDHHVLGTPFAKETFVAPTGACGEIIFDIACEFAARGKSLLNRSAAIALYAAICSDTGSFKFDSVTPETHKRIAALLEYDINHAEISRKLYDSRPISQVMATKVALCNLHFYNENRVAVINFTNKMREENNLTREDIDDIISLTRSIEGVEIGISIKQSDDDLTLYKVSMRSNRVADVSKLCAIFGGGGHKRAAGCTVNAENEYAAESMLIAEINNELMRLDKEGAFEHAGEI